MTTLVIGAGLIGSQVARILVERGEKPVLMDVAAQPQAMGQIVDLAKVTLVAGDILRPLSIVDVLKSHGITRIAHTAANPLLTLGAQREPYAAINLNIMGTVNVLEAARVTGLKRVVVSSSSVLNHYLDGGEDQGQFGKEEAFPRPTTFYSATKQAVESLGLNYAKWCGIEFAGLRYGAVFGPWSGAGGGGPSNIIREAMKNALAGKEATVPPGAMEWVYSKDAARGTVMALDAKDLGSRRVQHHHGRDDHAGRDGGGDPGRGARRQGEVRGAGRHRRVAVEPRPPCRPGPGQAHARLGAAVPVARGGEGPRRVDAAIFRVTAE